jgi:hypothetical protein
VITQLKPSQKPIELLAQSRVRIGRGFIDLVGPLRLQFHFAE